LSNLLNRRTAPTFISTRTLADLSEILPASGAAPSPAASLPAEWQELYDNGTAAEKHLVLALAEAGVDVPVQGEETPDGIPLGLAWPQLHVVVDIGYSDEDRADLSVAHWRVVEPTADAVRDALTAGRS
jgi:hypothetical protein